MKKLRTILRYLGVCDGNMEQGSLRCDANVSVRPVGQNGFGVKVEIKNINSFRFVEKALDYEIKRQTKVLEDGGEIVQETMLWDSSTGTTQSMRSKEEAHDYRYFPEPDLVPIMVEEKWINDIKSSLPELPDIKRKRFVEEYTLPEYDADLLVSEKSTADWFEEAVKLGGQPKAVANWIKGDLMKLLNEDNKSFEDSPLEPKQLVDMLKLIDNGTISGKIAKTVFEEMYKKTKTTLDVTLPMLKVKIEMQEVTAEAIIKEKGLKQISDSREIEKAVDDVIAKNPKEVERYKAGEEKLIGFFVGQVMKLTKGKANPQMVNELLKKKLRA
jgi:aspartyl-tRNA(Asn)/glutamyl-tRNA(Gln) amidotransferase subunit B